MKKIIFLFFVIGITIFLSFVQRYNYSNNRNKKINEVKLNLTLKISSTITREKIESRSIFVAYWNLGVGDYDRYIYFGITADNQGVNKSEIGYQKLDEFVGIMKGKETLITLRLLNDGFNKELLKDEILQQKIIDQTRQIAKEKNFSGIVLDLELFSLFDDGISGQINDFVSRFYTAVKQDYRSFGVILYGDAFFRGRPYDLSFIGKNSDEILVMAYDFHKSRGEPGPNFPLARRSPAQRDEDGPKTQTYDYDFKTMTTDYLRFVPAEKLTIIFGMFGYDWQVDEKKRPIAPAKALTLNQIKEKLLTKCDWKDCIIKRDNHSQETEINYVSSEIKNEFGYLDYHIVWFEDEQSVKVKTDYLLEKGIDNVGYWAWGYF